MCLCSPQESTDLFCSDFPSLYILLANVCMSLGKSQSLSAQTTCTCVLIQMCLDTNINLSLLLWGYPSSEGRAFLLPGLSLQRRNKHSCCQGYPSSDENSCLSRQQCNSVPLSYPAHTQIRSLTHVHLGVQCIAQLISV